MDASAGEKRRYAEREGERKRYEGKIGDDDYSAVTMAHLLHLFHPRFLELEEPWVDKLLEAEWDLKDKGRMNCLMYLLMS